MTMPYSNSLSSPRGSYSYFPESKGSTPVQNDRPVTAKAVDKDAALKGLAAWLQRHADGDLDAALPVYSAVHTAIEQGESGISLYYDGHGPQLEEFGFDVRTLPSHAAQLWSTSSSSSSSSSSSGQTHAGPDITLPHARVAMSPGASSPVPARTLPPLLDRKMDAFISLVKVLNYMKATVLMASKSLHADIRNAAQGDAVFERQLFEELAFRLNVLARNEPDAAPMVDLLFSSHPEELHLFHPSVSAYGPDIKPMLARLDQFVAQLPSVCTAETERQCEALIADFKAKAPVREPGIRENSLNELLAQEMQKLAASDNDKSDTVRKLFRFVPQKFQHYRPAEAVQPPSRASAEGPPALPPFANKFGKFLANLERIVERLPKDLPGPQQDASADFKRFRLAVEGLRSFISRQDAGMHAKMNRELDAELERLACVNPSISYMLRSYKSPAEG